MYIISLMKLWKYNMPNPLQTVITLQRCYHAYTYIDLNVWRNKKNEKAAVEKKNKFRRRKKIKTNSAGLPAGQ